MVLGAAAGIVRVLGTAASSLLLDTVSAGHNLIAAGPQARRVLRVQVVILRDDNGPLCAPSAVQPALVCADQVFSTVGIRVRPYPTVVAPGQANGWELAPRANRVLLWDDVLGRTAGYRAVQPPGPRAGAPVTVVVVGEIAGNTVGCSLGLSADWVICQANQFDSANPASFDPTVLAHELAHALNLPHCRDQQNLMYPVSSPPGELRGVRLSRLQGAALRANRHVLTTSVG